MMTVSKREEIEEMESATNIANIRHYNEYLSKVSRLRRLEAERDAYISAYVSKADRDIETVILD